MNAKSIAIIVFLALAASAFALQGKVVAVSGKVEFQAAQGTWKPLKQGDSIQAGTVISTGFKSQATIQLGASVLTVKPLTRMTLSELAEKEDTVDTELYLEVGNVRAEVNSYNNKRNGFTVRSPSATASVRGTAFSMGRGRLTVERGIVRFTGKRGKGRLAKAGQGLDLFAGSVTPPQVQLLKPFISLSRLPSLRLRSVILTCIPPLAPESSGSVERKTITLFDVE